jgi:hypothetical protein
VADQQKPWRWVDLGVGLAGSLGYGSGRSVDTRLFLTMTVLASGRYDTASVNAYLTTLDLPRIVVPSELPAQYHGI